MNNNAPRHVVFGTGAIGLATLEALRRRGESVRMVNRSGSAQVPDGVEVVGGDAADPKFTIEVSRDAQVIYQTLNPAIRALDRGVPRACRPASWPPPRPTGRGLSAWRTFTCTGVRPAGR